MNVIYDAANSQHFLALILNNACDVFEKLFFPIRGNESGSILNCKNDLDIYLGKCSSHCDGAIPSGSREFFSILIYKHMMPSASTAIRGINDR